MGVGWAWPIHRGALAGVLALAVMAVSTSARGQRSLRPELSFGAGFARQPDDNSGHLERTGTHVQGALRLPVGERAAARLTFVYEHFGVRSAAPTQACDPSVEACPFEPTRLPFALGLVALTVTGRSDTFGGRLYGGAGAGMHHAFRSPWLGERTGFGAHAVLGATLGPEPRGLGIEASVHHLMNEHSGAPWLIPIGLTWTF